MGRIAYACAGRESPSRTRLGNRRTCWRTADSNASLEIGGMKVSTGGPRRAMALSLAGYQFKTQSGPSALYHVKRLTRTNYRHARNPFPPSAERGSRNVDDLDPTSPHRILGRERVVHPAKPRDQIIARIGCEHRNQIDVAHIHFKVADHQRPEQVESRQRGTGGL